MKTLAILFLLIFSHPDSVYICMGSSSHSYHTSAYCKGLKHCSTSLKKVSLADAINVYHRKECGYCLHRKIRIKTSKHEVVDR